MSIFPDVGPELYEEKDKAILNQMSDFYRDAISVNQSFWAEADLDTRFEAGDQSVYQELYNNMPSSLRKQFNFNRIKRVINMISGHQRRNRKNTIVSPVENSDQQTADQFSKILVWSNQQEGTLETLSDSFHGALVTGMNLLQVWVDYRNDPISGNIRVDNCSYNSFLIDPFFKKQDLSDCNAIWKRSFLSRNECLSLLPDKKEELSFLAPKSSNDDKFQFLPENYNNGANTNKLLSYDEFYYRDYRNQRMLIDTQTGEAYEWVVEKEDELNRFLSMYPQITVIEQQIPTVKVAIVVQGKVMYNGANPMGIDQYPFVPVLGYYTPQIPYFPLRIQGVVRGLRDAQYLYNRRKAIELDILESQINSGWKYKENALVNPKDVFLSGQGRGLALKEDAQMTDVEQIMSPQVPPTTMQLSESLAKEVQEISGVNEELLGSATDDKAGILSMLRQGAGLTTLQTLFDQLDRSQKLLGKLMINIIQNNFTPGKIQKIIEQEPSPQFYNKTFGKYDAAVEEGILTTTQKQMQFAQLLNLKEVGVNVPDTVIIDSATIQNKEELKQAIEQEQKQAQQMQQQQMQVEQQELQARTDLAHARAEADRSLGQERVSRIPENRAMAIANIAEANKDDEQAALNKLKAISELEEIDLSNLEKLIMIANTLKATEQGSKEILKAKAGLGVSSGTSGTPTP